MLNDVNSFLRPETFSNLSKLCVKHRVILSRRRYDPGLVSIFRLRDRPNLQTDITQFVPGQQAYERTICWTSL
jgi:hypothetical protein